ncbi:hypothetical protein ACOMYX_19625 (plasmid) [Pantoea agglomerans]|jgi:hypothetical protein|uniref:hypothetical protein n=1 Tax=Pantoea TaxID=53335 RepID=UPI0031F579C4
MTTEQRFKVNPNLRNNKVFSDKKMKAGIPHQMYILLLFVNGFALLLAIKFFSLFSVLAFVIFLLITVLPIYTIHMEDRDAHVAWRSAIIGAESTDNSQTTQRKVKFIKLSDIKDTRK